VIPSQKRLCKVLFRFILKSHGPKVSRGSLESFAVHLLSTGADNDSQGSTSMYRGG
jgi:hypothetical protein